MKCVKNEQCGCYDKQGEHYSNHERVPSTENCQIWYAFISCQELQPTVIKYSFNFKMVYSIAIAIPWRSTANTMQQVRKKYLHLWFLLSLIINWLSKCLYSQICSLHLHIQREKISIWWYNIQYYRWTWQLHDSCLWRTWNNKKRFIHLSNITSNNNL